MTNENATHINRTYKSTVFTMLFEDKGNLLELYNAMSGRHYTNPELLEVNTLENAIYMSMKNDISFLIDNRISLYEHQSTYSPNLPLRFLFYISNLYSGMTRTTNLYGTKRMQIPLPEFVVFYNGKDERPDFTGVCGIHGQNPEVHGEYESGRGSRTSDRRVYPGGDFERIFGKTQNGGEEYVYF